MICLFACTLLKLLHNIDLDYISNIEVGKNPLKPTRTQKTHQNPTQKPIALKKPRVFTNSVLE